MSAAKQSETHIVGQETASVPRNVILVGDALEVLRGLPDRRRHTARTPEQRGDLHYISEADVWRLACEHPLDVFPRGLSAEQWVWLAGLAPCGTGHGRKSA